VLKNSFQQPVKAVYGSTSHSSNTQVFEEWSTAKTALFALRAEKPAMIVSAPF
jgi:hypothetical protein